VALDAGLEGLLHPLTHALRPDPSAKPAPPADCAL